MVVISINSIETSDLIIYGDGGNPFTLSKFNVYGERHIGFNWELREQKLDTPIQLNTPVSTKSWQFIYEHPTPVLRQGGYFLTRIEIENTGDNAVYIEGYDLEGDLVVNHTILPGDNVIEGDVDEPNPPPTSGDGYQTQTRVIQDANGLNYDSNGNTTSLENAVHYLITVNESYLSSGIIKDRRIYTNSTPYVEMSSSKMIIRDELSSQYGDFYIVVDKPSETVPDVPDVPDDQDVPDKPVIIPTTTRITTPNEFTLPIGTYSFIIGALMGMVIIW